MALLAPALACTEPNPFINICGNGVVEPANDEECDDGMSNSDAAACTMMCKIATCGDGLVHADVEVCDKGAENNDQGSCTSQCKPPACGDGIRQFDEECDDGALNKWPPDGAGGCSIQCAILPECGDGVIHPEFEECDDANDVDTDACTTACKAAVCGDGIVYAGVEECDDGNADDTDSCTSACHYAACGDGIVQPPNEECDDANDQNDDACLSVCVQASCGDGVLRTGVEECDDGNTNDDDGCSEECVLDRLVFILDEPISPFDIVGLSGAGVECRKLAMIYDLPDWDNYKAWLSDGVNSPSTVFKRSPGRYVLVTGEVIAQSWDDLVDGELLHPINRTANGELRDNGPVWTGTYPDGTAAPGDSHCNNWTDSMGNYSAQRGSSSEVTGPWTDIGAPTSCTGTAYLYCFQQ